MASTFVDNYTLIDVVNTQDPASTQYNEKQKTGTFDKDSYIPTSSTVHTIPTAYRSLPDGAILDDGANWKAIYETLLAIQVNWDNAMRQLDDSSLDTGNYEDSCVIGNLHETYNNENTTTFGGATTQLVTLQGIDTNINVHLNGAGTKEIATLCQAIAHSFNACLDMLDADTTLNDDDYSDERILFTAKTAWCPPVTADSIVFDIKNTASKIKTNGIHREALVDFLNTVITQMNALWVKLDADI